MLVLASPYARSIIYIDVATLPAKPTLVQLKETQACRGASLRIPDVNAEIVLDHLH